MMRATLASTTLVAITLLGSTGCGGHHHRARYCAYAHMGVYAHVGVAPAAPVAPAYEEAPPQAPPQRVSPRIVHMQSPQLPPGTTLIIVNPTPAQAAGHIGPVAPAPQPAPQEDQEEEQQAPAPAPQQAPQQGWFQGE